MSWATALMRRPCCLGVAAGFRAKELGEFHPCLKRLEAEVPTVWPGNNFGGRPLLRNGIEDAEIVTDVAEAVAFVKERYLVDGGAAGICGDCRLCGEQMGRPRLTMAAALDLASDGNPGHVDPSLTDPHANDRGDFPRDGRRTADPRFGEADEVARMVRFMFTEAAYSTGCAFVVDGGATTGQVLRLPSSS